MIKTSLVLIFYHDLLKLKATFSMHAHVRFLISPTILGANRKKINSFKKCNAQRCHLIYNLHVLPMHLQIVTLMFDAHDSITH